MCNTSQSSIFATPCAQLIATSHSLPRCPLPRCSLRRALRRRFSCGSSTCSRGSTSLSGASWSIGRQRCDTGHFAGPSPDSLVAVVSALLPRGRQIFALPLESVRVSHIVPFSNTLLLDQPFITSQVVELSQPLPRSMLLIQEAMTSVTQALLKDLKSSRQVCVSALHHTCPEAPAPDAMLAPLSLIAWSACPPLSPLLPYPSLVVAAHRCLQCCLAMSNMFNVLCWGPSAGGHERPHNGGRTVQILRPALAEAARPYLVRHSNRESNI